ncbi:Serine/threonine-protein kinase PLK1 like protein [Argiope bruennichi]|uniref:Serine/threonine-protein kinase PLK1 like protein n=1 Tax=Argiope bruennichi TaxID=94029 RepID=A0A8T0FNC9_ARGBR|nr:Serine/threonine-protein kinase PLK1 like protein [Argiope bruennichi]
MTVSKAKETVDLKVKLRSGASVVRVRPLFTRDSKYLIIACGSDVKVHSIQSGECVHILRYHKTRVISLQENKTNHLQVFSCSDDGIVVRWDHSEGKCLQVYNLRMPVSSFYIPSSANTWFVSKKVESQDQHRLYSLISKPTRSENIQMIVSPVLPYENAISFGSEGKFVASIHGNSLTVVKLDVKAVAKHLTGERTLKCVTCHPSDFILATGDDQGRILVWSNLLDTKSPIRSIYHWHTLPVADIVFSTEGSYLYSGGGEAALVKWNLFSDEKSILPRLGAPFYRLNTSFDSSFVVTAHTDNSLQIINSQKIVVQMIQGLTQGHFQGAKTANVLPTGLLYDPLNKALVLNGKPGHLQFYNINEDKQLFNLDISGRNFISQERENVVLNTDVQKAAIDDKGQWLATAEFWDDGETSPQIWLKFWEFDVSKQTFVLNTNVYSYHTTKNLKDDIRYDDKQSWTCESMGCFRNLPAEDACFSEDGSLLAVSFDNMATLWTLDKPSLKTMLCHKNKSNKIRQLVFGRQSCCHLLICHDADSIIAWDVLSLSMKWIVHTSVERIVADSTSDIIAAFCSDHTLNLFKPDNPGPLYTVENVSQKPIIAAIFVPLKEENSSFLKTSQLFFFDEDQNLLTLTDEENEMESPDTKEKYEELKQMITNPKSKVTYRRGCFLGKGGFARCYEFRNVATGETFAGKVVSKTMLIKPHHKEKMFQEIQIHSSLAHKYIVSLHSYFEDESNMYIILELCRKRSLMEMHKRRKTLTVPEVRYFMRQIVLACKYMHDNKVIHRDLKLGNLFINDEMEIKVGDFGLATRINHDGERKKTLCGTPNYIAPEILTKIGHSYEVDIWSLGCIMYTLLVGSPPFETSTLQSTYKKIKKCEYFLPPSLDRSARVLIQKLLHSDPDMRPSSTQYLG